jgi:uracil-DNA glycosylase
MFDFENLKWKDFLENESKKNYFKNIYEKYIFSKKDNIIYPSEDYIFNVFNLDINDIKVVILGQDPYYNLCKKTNEPFAMGLSFSVNPNCNIPKSLKNIFKKIKNNKINGDLTNWSKQGVFLLNTQLTVIKNKPNSHKFWNKFTDKVIQYINDELDDIIFVLWGNNSLKKEKLINKNKHHIIISSHPSPLSFKRKLKDYPSFNEINCFELINNYLKNKNKEMIEW